MTRTLVALMLMVLLATSVGAAPPAITLSSEFKFGYAPATVKVRIQVEPNPDNRLVCLEYDGGSYSQSCWEVNATTPRTTWRTLVRIPAGDYIAVAQVVLANGRSRVSNRLEFTVLASGPQSD